VIPALFENWDDFRLFGYISFRMAMAALFAFAFALWWGRPVIAWLRAKKLGEDVSKVDSAALAAKAEAAGKKGTPTMGGSFLIAALLASVLLWARIDNVHVMLGVFLTAGLGAVGFIDDWVKLTVPGKKGIAPLEKMIGLSIVTLAVLALLAWYARMSGRDTLLSLYPPFFKDVSIGLGALGLLGAALFVAFAWFVIVGSANAVNITDGLDGLAAGCMVIVGLSLSIFCYVTGRADWSAYLDIPHVTAAAEMAVVGAAVCGACLGFLWYNAHPAEVFMGDSGSLPLGGLMGWMAVVSKQELVLPLIALVFVLDLSTSWLQTAWFRRTKKLHGEGRRIFTQAPIHNGLWVYGGVFRRRERGWHEVKVVVRFWIIAALAAMGSLALLKVR
jgi:phospho-N-acetylmuramoyl-pentapeptide-transferase